MPGKRLKYSHHCASCFVVSGLGLFALSLVGDAAFWHESGGKVWNDISMQLIEQDALDEKNMNTQPCGDLYFSSRSHGWSFGVVKAALCSTLIIAGLGILATMETHKATVRKHVVSHLLFAASTMAVSIGLGSISEFLLLWAVSQDYLSCIFNYSDDFNLSASYEENLISTNQTDPSNPFSLPFNMNAVLWCSVVYTLFSPVLFATQSASARNDPEEWIVTEGKGKPRQQTSLLTNSNASYGAITPAPAAESEIGPQTGIDDGGSFYATL